MITPRLGSVSPNFGMRRFIANSSWLTPARSDFAECLSNLRSLGALSGHGPTLIAPEVAICSFQLAIAGYWLIFNFFTNVMSRAISEPCPCSKR